MGAAGFRRRALLAGDPDLLWHLPPMLDAAGFDVDVVTLAGTHLHRSREIRAVTLAPSLSDALVVAAEQSRADRYDWIIIGDDATLRLLRVGEGLDADDQVRLAPVTDPDFLDQLGSKVVLAQRLERLAVGSPRFRLAASAEEAAAATHDFGGRALLKPDAGSGGAGIISATGPKEAAVGWHLLAARQESPAERDGAERVVLVQEFIEGRLVDVSGIFFNGRLVHYTYAHMFSADGGHAASSLRHYYPTSTVSPAIVDELSVIGAGLRLHGFANVTCIESPDGTSRRYFEADARPNLWAAIGAEFGDDPVARLRLWFDEGRTDLAAVDNSPSATATTPPQPREVAMFKRLPRRDLIRNRHGVWRDIPWRSPEARRLFWRAILP